MKKIVKSGIIAALCAMLVLPTVACSGSAYDNETRKFSMAIGAIDGNFNPFFYTAANDGTVASMTQAAMLTTDNDGNIACGEDYPTVVKDYTIKYYDTNNNEIGSDSATSATTDHTTYSFLIKNGMKFSDGEDLTVMDVLFSLYVNIDKAYTGSATLYSNDIQGLKAYREQENISDDANLSSDTSFNTQAQQRITNIINYCTNTNASVSNVTQVQNDIETVKKLFLEELTSDWTTAEETFGSRDEDTFEYTFTETWQYYYLQEGVISVLTEKNSNNATVEKKDANGKYLTTLDEETMYATEVENAKKDASAIKAYTDKGYDEETAVEYVVRDFCINYIWESMTGGYGAENTVKSGIATICQYWGTASTALEEIAGEIRTAYYSALKESNGGNLVIPTISGVTVSRVTNFNGENLGDAYDVLTITINDVDPKAIWNFAFSVCPLHYYSGTFEGKNYVKAAQDDYAAYLAAYEKGDSYTLTEFGVECGNSDFFNDVLQDTAKNGLPVGAGAYAASNSSGTKGDSDSFYTNKYVYYMRNEYFYTMGEGIENAKIKYIVYSEMSDNSILNALIEQEVDYGTPSATTKNQTQLSAASSYLDSGTLYDTNGYGYVGINPKYVPDVKIRQAIMKAMNTATILNYYSTEYASTIYRPMSKTSWAYPENCTEYYSIAHTESVTEIKKLVESAGYYPNSDGIYTNGTTTCKFTFTIAGDSTDHPAYDMFCDAKELLEQCGFEITVKTDSTALNKLATGNLEVWAAAWSSAIDPDLYQVYHKDSTASSVKNWNYSEILSDSNKWGYEYAIIQELSDVIDDARETNNQTTRKSLYSTALDLIMDLAVELPTYQRKDNEVYNKSVIDSSSLNQNPSTYASLIDRIWEVEYN
ncbi:MAG: ABC transporter substrate-binding protein [Clostridia bacterium]|nr:ABC transporter substrate-binding protein [Clostridia bacterium]